MSLCPWKPGEAFLEKKHLQLEGLEYERMVETWKWHHPTIWRYSYSRNLVIPEPSKGLNFLLDHDCCSFGKFGVRLKNNGSRGDENARLCTIDVRS